MLGGFSAEREVSLKTGAAAAKALRSLGHTVHELDPQDDAWTLPPKTDVVFLALHGTYGEDGQVQARLEKLGVPYTGCGVEASRLAFDKVITKQRCVEAGVPTAKFMVFDAPGATWPMGWQPPVVLKPVRQGSSVGLQFVDRVADFGAALAEALRHDTQVLMEERIVGRETTVAILDGQALPVVEVRPKEGTYDYTNKVHRWQDGILLSGAVRPAGDGRDSEGGTGAFNAVRSRLRARGCDGARERRAGGARRNNTLPGMTGDEFVAEGGGGGGISYPDLCQRMIDLAMKRVGKS